MQLAYIKTDRGFEGGLTFQVSADVYHSSSLVWGEPLVGFFYSRLLAAEPQFDLYGVHKIASAKWREVASYARELADKIRSGGEFPADYFVWDESEYREFREGGDETLRRLGEALALTARWLE